MKKIVFALFLCCCTFVACADELPLAGVREAAVADRFYPGDAGKLEGAVKAYLEDALPANGERPIGLVAPHAGYVYSGQVAADAYAQAVGYDYDVVIILGTNHTIPGFDQVSVYYGEGYRTPLGVAKIDAELALELMESDADFVFREDVHAQEHSVEVQVPFVQVAFPEAEIVTAVIGAPDPDLTERFGLALARVLKGRKGLIVASSDLSHYPTGEGADAVDRKVLAAVASLDPTAVSGTISRQMRAGVSGLSTCACGEGPMLATMVAAKALGATRGIAVNYVHSGGTLFGDNSRVVGYGAVSFTAGEGGTDTLGLERDASIAVSAGLSAEDKEYLLHFARETIEQYLTTGTVPLPRVSRPALWSRQGAFVTLEKHGQLRGCIGHMAEDTPLVLTVGRMALQAALRDRRFRPVGAEEIPDLELEISVLTPFARVAGPEEIVIGRDGVVVQKEGHRAVYLPQVAPEQGWDLEETLGHLCAKAGLGADCWQQGAEFYTFQADVFGEGEEF